MKETHKVILTDKEFGREVEIATKGNLIHCLKFMDNRRFCKKCGDHYETYDNNFIVSIDKIYE